MHILSFKSVVQPVIGVEKSKCVFILYLAFFMLSGFFAVDVAFFTHDNLEALLKSHCPRKTTQQQL